MEAGGGEWRSRSATLFGLSAWIGAQLLQPGVGGGLTAGHSGSGGREGLREGGGGDAKHGGRFICLKTTRGSWTSRSALRSANSLFALAMTRDEENQITGTKKTKHWSPACRFVMNSHQRVWLVVVLQDMRVCRVRATLRRLFSETDGPISSFLYAAAIKITLLCNYFKVSKYLFFSTSAHLRQLQKKKIQQKNPQNKRTLVSARG